MKWVDFVCWWSEHKWKQRFKDQQICDRCKRLKTYCKTYDWFYELPYTKDKEELIRGAMRAFEAFSKECKCHKCLEKK